MTTESFDGITPIDSNVIFFGDKLIVSRDSDGCTHVEPTHSPDALVVNGPNGEYFMQEDGITIVALAYGNEAAVVHHVEGEEPTFINTTRPKPGLLQRSAQVMSAFISAKAGTSSPER